MAIDNSERALVCCISDDPAVIGSEVLSVFQADNPFTDDIVKRVYHAWASQPDRSVWNSPAILDKLQTSVFEADWFEELRGIIYAVPSSANWRQHLEDVKDAYVRRKAKEVLEQAAYEIEGASNCNEFLSTLSKKLVTVGVSSEDEQSVEEAIEAELERRRNDTLVINTGLSKIDRLTGNLIPGDIFLLAARPSVGKSVVAHNIAKNMAQRFPVGVFSMEMTIPQVVGRMVSGAAQFDSRHVLDNFHQQEVWKAYEWVKSLPIYYDDRAGLSSAQIVNRIRRWHVNHGIKAVIIDYVQLIKGYGKGNEVISNALKDIKSVCTELKIVPIVLAQINRAGAKNEDGRPTLEDLKGAGALEEDSSYVVLMHRDIVLTAEEQAKVDGGEAIHIDVAVAKNRHGPTGYKRLAFVPKYCLVQDEYIASEDIPT